MRRRITTMCGIVCVLSLTWSGGSFATAAVNTPLAVGADAGDRALLKAGLQRSWAKTDSSARYKACWMWVNRPNDVKAGLVSSFRGTGISSSDVYSVARSFFNNVC